MRFIYLFCVVLDLFISFSQSIGQIYPAEVVVSTSHCKHSKLPMSSATSGHFHYFMGVKEPFDPKFPAVQPGACPEDEPNLLAD